ncbi:MAG: DNA polymerase I [Salibacteraceae bacterium]
MAEDKRLFLLDAYALIFRAYYSFISNPRINSKGLNTSAIFGFTNTLWSLLQKENPTHIAVVFDPPGDKSFRVEQYEHYKANRDATPEDIKKSVPYIKSIIEAFRIPVIQMDGYEADDVIGTLAKKAARNGYDVFMVTPDKDFGQLVEDHIYMYKPGRQGGDVELIGVKEILEKYGIEKPEQVIDILGLMGDSVDNIPGIPGVGEKTAVKFVQQFGSVEGLYENIDQLKGKMKEKVESNRDMALLSKQLATIITDVPIDLDEKNLIREQPDKEKLIELFTELEFRQLSKNILGEEIAVKQPDKEGQLDLFGSDGNDASRNANGLVTMADTDHNYRLVKSLDEVSELAEMLKNSKSFCFDTETTHLDPHRAELVGISFCLEPGKAWYLPIEPNRVGALKQLDTLRPIFENSSIEKTGQNIKYDIEVLRHYGIHVRGKLFDTMIAQFLINPDMKNNLDDMAAYYLGYKPVSIESLIGPKGKNQRSMRDVPVEKVADYAAEDADITMRLKLILEQEINKEEYLIKLFNEVECPLIHVLCDMECAGIRIDTEALENMSKALDKESLELQDRIFKLAGIEFNLDSPKQLGEVLFDHLKIDENAKRTKTGQYQTNEDTLQKLADKHEIIPLILEYRSVKKLKSTYVDSLPQLVNPQTGRLHTNYMQTVAVTGRLSSNNPNLQNIPIRTERGKEIRKAFVPANEDYLIMAADYSQVELRILAAISNDEGMIAAFKNGEDIHAATAAKIFGVALNEVTREMRAKAKAVNFGIAYGQGAFGLAQNLNISRSEAKEIIDNYFKQFPGLLRYKEESIARAREKGYAETILGRRRYLRDINSKNHTVRSAAERNAINTPIQGSAADIIKLAMIHLHKRMNKKVFKSKMLLQVHDELVFDAHRDEIDELKELVRHEMENAYELSVPLVVDIKTGNNWLEAH